MPDALRIEYAEKPSRVVKVYKCKTCDNEVRIRNDNKNHAGFCQSCSHRKRPFESIYNGLFNDRRNTPVNLTYDEFIEFTKIKNCHYCNINIPWSEYSIKDGEFLSRAYYLDRKDNSLGYSKENCVVCCTECNKLRGDRLTYDEMVVAMKAVIEYRNRA